MAGRFVDFYALLDVAPDASFDAVRSAVVQQRRACESPPNGDPSTQQSADDRIRDLDLAELVLLDPTQRADYDEEWHTRHTTPATNGTTPPAPSTGPTAPPGASTGHAPPAAGPTGHASSAAGPAAATDASDPAAWPPPQAGNGHAAAPASEGAAWPAGSPADSADSADPGAPAGEGAAPAGISAPDPAAWPAADAGNGHAVAPVDWAAADASGWAPATGPTGRPADPSGPAALPAQPPTVHAGEYPSGAESGAEADPGVLSAQPPTAHAAGDGHAAPSAQPPTVHAAADAADNADDDDWVAQARAAVHAGDTARAIDSYHYAIMLHPNAIGLHYELGQAYGLAGNHEQALGAFQTATRLAPQVADHRAAAGDALVRLGRPGEAISVLEQVVAEAPTEPRYRASLAQALHDTCVHEMTPLDDGMVCITTGEQAQLVERLTGRALSLLDPSDQSQLAQDIREKYRLAQLANQRVWRPPLPWWVMVPFALVLTLGFALIVGWWMAPIVLVVLGGVAFLLGLRPTYWHVAREARSANLLA